MIPRPAPACNRPSPRNFLRRKWHVYEPVDLDLGRQAASLAYNSPVEPLYKSDKAQVIVSLDCDFIGSEENAYANIRDFTKGKALSNQTVQ
jgi:hypothetical protein